jgi:hypothetical protein
MQAVHLARELGVLVLFQTEGFELIQSQVLYEYADPDFEPPPPLDKQLLRLVSMNFARLEIHLWKLRTGL